MPYNLTYHAYSIFTATCASGQGAQVTADASAESIISQRDADRKAEDFARTLAVSRLNCLFPPAPGEIRYYSEPVVVTDVCGAGSADPIGPFDPNKIFTVSLPAGSVYSTVSVEDATAAAQVRAQFELGVLLLQKCEAYYANTEQSATAVCVAPLAGPNYTATVPADTVTSFVSQQVVDELAQASAVAQAQAGLSCVQGIPNTAQSYTATCAEYDDGNYVGPDVTVTVPTGVFFDLTEEAANITALAFATAQALAALPTNCVASYANVQKTATITCQELYEDPTFGNGGQAVVEANQYFSDVSQDEANDAACAAAWAQALASMDCFCPNSCVEKLPPPVATCT
jgi:hypothetical protein